MIEQRIEDREFVLAIERIKIVDFKNVHFTTESGQPLDLKYSDFWRISSDKENTEEQSKSLTYKEIKEQLGSRFKKDVNAE